LLAVISYVTEIPSASSENIAKERLSQKKHEWLPPSADQLKFRMSAWSVFYGSPAPSRPVLVQLPKECSHCVRRPCHLDLAFHPQSLRHHTQIELLLKGFPTNQIQRDIPKEGEDPIITGIVSGAE
jgi:hypothetical protein